MHSGSEPIRPGYGVAVLGRNSRVNNACCFNVKGNGSAGVAVFVNKVCGEINRSVNSINGDVACNDCEVSPINGVIISCCRGACFCKNVRLGAFNGELNFLFAVVINERSNIFNGVIGGFNIDVFSLYVKVFPCAGVAILCGNGNCLCNFILACFNVELISSNGLSVCNIGCGVGVESIDKLNSIVGSLYFVINGCRSGVACKAIACNGNCGVHCLVCDNLCSEELSAFALHGNGNGNVVSRGVISHNLHISDHIRSVPCRPGYNVAFLGRSRGIGNAC